MSKPVKLSVNICGINRACEHPLVCFVGRSRQFRHYLLYPPAEHIIYFISGPWDALQKIQTLLYGISIDVLFAMQVLLSDRIETSLFQYLGQSARVYSKVQTVCVCFPSLLNICIAWTH